MRRFCECGRPAVALAGVRRFSSRRVKRRRPGALRNHDLFIQCWRKWCDRFLARQRAEREEQESMPQEQENETP